MRPHLLDELGRVADVCLLEQGRHPGERSLSGEPERAGGFGHVGDDRRSEGKELSPVVAISQFLSGELVDDAVSCNLECVEQFGGRWSGPLFDLFVDGGSDSAVGEVVGGTARYMYRSKYSALPTPFATVPRPLISSSRGNRIASSLRTRLVSSAPRRQFPERICSQRWRRSSTVGLSKLISVPVSSAFDRTTRR